MLPQLFLVRHAHSVDAGHDAARPLSERGREQVRHLAAILGRGGAFAPTQVWYSPLLRARETAELLARELKLEPAFTERDELLPEASPERLVTVLRTARAPLALFGHEPHMSALASLLVTGYAAPVVFCFRKATMLSLEHSEKQWIVSWQLSPDLFPRPVNSALRA